MIFQKKNSKKAKKEKLNNDIIVKENKNDKIKAKKKDKDALKLDIVEDYMKLLNKKQVRGKKDSENVKEKKEKKK